MVEDDRGIFPEHAHRLLGSLVGALTATLAALPWAVESRAWVRALGIGAYLAKFHAADVALGPGFSVALPVAHRLAGGSMLILAAVVTLRLHRRTGRLDPALAREPFSRKAPA